jgi:acyl-CoA reductase-like NAD-dependent aldehyde dehydrogenase
MVPLDASTAGEGRLGFTLRLPIGVIGAISPFNFPAEPRRPQAGARHLPPAARWCSKPASQTPLSARRWPTCS